MKQKLKCILLVDDNEADNFIHTRVIKKMGCAEEIKAVRGGQEALDYLTSLTENHIPQPELIFLDINMPSMNGFEFLERYQKTIPKELRNIVIMMLTTSLNPDDRLRSDTIEEVKDYKNKPLAKKLLTEILEMHYPSAL